MRVFRELWAKIVARWVRRVVSGRPGAALPPPNTLIERIERLEDRDRELLRVAEEAQRRGYPDQARAAYWKAAHHYIADGRNQKALSVLGAILRLRPDDHDALVARAFALGNLERRHDAALAFHDVALLFESKGATVRALEMLELCLDFDPSIEGLRDDYLRLGGQRDVWSDPASVRVATHDLPARVASAVASIPIESLRIAALSASDPDTIPNLELDFARDLPPIELRVERVDATVEEGPLHLDLELDDEDIMRGPPQQTPRPPVRFTIPTQETVYEPGPPASMRHDEPSAEEAPKAARLSIVDAETQAFDKDLLASLLERSRGQR